MKIVSDFEENHISKRWHGPDPNHKSHVQMVFIGSQLLKKGFVVGMLDPQSEDGFYCNHANSQHD